MLGRLLNTAASTFGPSHSSRSPAQLESVTEEEHTSGLLFPDVSLLLGSKTHAFPLQTSASSPNASSAGSFDDRGGLDVDAYRDFRVIIAQNAIADRDDPCVLLDTQTMSQIDPSGRPPLEYQLMERTRRRGHSRTATLSRAPSRVSTHGSQSSIPELDPTPSSLPRKQEPAATSAFLQARNRRSTFSVTSGDTDPQSSRLAAEANEVGLLHCVFGSSAFNYRGSSTKMHILPGGGEPPREVDSSYGSHGVKRRSPLHRSTTNWPQTQSPSSLRGPPTRQYEPKAHGPAKVAVLVTRMFSVNLPEPHELSADSQEQPPSSGAESVNESEFPFLEARKRKKIKEKKTPMYAVAMIIQLPLGTRGRPSSQYTFGGDGSKNPAYLSASLDSTQRNSGTFVDDHIGSGSSSNLDDRIDALVEHWDIINRTLSYLEQVASKEILALLKQVDALSARHPKPFKPPNMQRTNQRIVQLPSGILFSNMSLREELLRSMHRVSLALSIPRVITGQSRWGIWREEARWVARFLNDKEHNFFLLVLITAFLGNHTEWLSLLGPDWYRRRYQLQQKAQPDNELIISNRTVIISPDKMTARRLIFILSAFLPAQQRSDGGVSPLRPGTATSVHPHCMSPPNTAPISRQQSLRRTINRRNCTRQQNEETGGLRRSASIISNETSALPSEDVDCHKTESLHSRTDSDAKSIRTAGLPIHPYDARGARGFTPTATTAAPGSATPVPHFASQRDQLRKSGPDHQMYDNNASAASANLMQQLQRSESFGVNPAAGERRPSGTWGSLFSGFWGSRDPSSAESRGPAPASRASVRRASVIPRQEEKVLSAFKSNKGANRHNSIDMTASNEYESEVVSPESQSTTSPDVDNSRTQDDTERHSLDSPVKLSVEANDGIVDVEVPLPGFFSLSTSGDSILTSPKKARTSITSVDSATSIHSGLYASQKDQDGLNINVAGWLKYYHDDFLLQATCPYPDIEADIKRSMASEPTPSNIGSASANVTDSPSGRWVEVCSTLVADTRTFTVKRLRLRRKVPVPDPQKPQEGTSPTSPYDSLLTTQISNHSSASAGADQSGFEEEFVEEPVMDLDGTLVDAVERVIARSGPPSAIHSRATSPSRLRRGKSNLSEINDARKAEIPTVEVPRNECRRAVVSALEEVVRSVAAERRQDDPNVARVRGVAAGSFTDNTLREGIRKWLLDIEEAC